MLKVITQIANNPNLEKVNFQIEKKEKSIFLNQKLFEWDIIQIKENSFHIIYQNQSFKAEVLKVDFESKIFQIQINQSVYELEAHDKFDMLLQKLGMDKSAVKKVSEIKAPMPGLILEIKVSDGQTIKKGDALMILEAMKMENVLKSPIDGIIKAVKVKKGDNVEKNTILIQFEV